MMVNELILTTSLVITFVVAFQQPVSRPSAFRIGDNRLFGVTAKPTTHRFQRIDSDSYDSSPFAVAFNGGISDLTKHRPLPVNDPALVEFASTASYTEAAALEEKAAYEALQSSGDSYPVAAMMQCSAPYIATHAGKVAVFHIPGDIIDHPGADNLLSDMALSWILGMKLVIVVGSRYDLDVCDVSQYATTHECYNTLKVTDKEAMRHIEEDAGFLRTEIERKLNRYIRMHASVTSSKDNDGYVVSGNYYTAKHFGIVRGQDFQHTGYASDIHSEQIHKVLKNNDVVLLSTVGLSRQGDLVNVNGYHLAATVAGSLNAEKLIYMANEGSILQKKHERLILQEIPLSFTKSLLDYHQVKVFNTGFASFEKARKTLNSNAVELLIHLGWATWALERGVTRAHIVNPADGALLEELFTSKNGANTCLYHDDELKEPEDEMAQEWEEFFATTTPSEDYFAAASWTEEVTTNFE